MRPGSPNKEKTVKKWLGFIQFDVRCVCFVSGPDLSQSRFIRANQRGKLSSEGGLSEGCCPYQHSEV
jgi:hypothetical protein